ncbi:hypothetical protein I5E68_03505 [Novosphingobium sp. YJ-S2-02]|uniref:Uncharacterized protein n=1 Tax=Novosphingobium aureum TaxID=2792964 RepID=A0A931HAK5_9SPHN|nr:hypothetical protein [Novosphingobium aureum]MBH0112018.1 hypothetical protein [Novosphingobium aureum]
MVAPTRPAILCEQYPARNFHGGFGLANVGELARLTWTDPGQTDLAGQVDVPMLGTHPVEMAMREQTGSRPGVFKLPLPQTTSMVASPLEMVDLDWLVPDRCKLLIDSTGILARPRGVEKSTLDVCQGGPKAAWRTNCTPSPMTMAALRPSSARKVGSAITRARCPCAKTHSRPHGCMLPDRLLGFMELFWLFLHLPIAQ